MDDAASMVEVRRRSKRRFERRHMAAGIKELNDLSPLNADSRNAAFHMRRRRCRSQVQNNVVALDRHAAPGIPIHELG
jgi:hypothetical protein